MRRFEEHISGCSEVSLLCKTPISKQMCKSVTFGEYITRKVCGNSFHQSILFCAIMIGSVVLLCLCASAYASVLPQQNDTFVFLTKDNRIIGGHEAQKHAYPFMARILVTWTHNKCCGLCGASLINANWVMSAGHCVYNLQDGTKWEKVVVFLGDHNSILPEIGEVRIDAETVVINPSYISQGIHDISLIKLKTKVEFTDFIKPVCLSPPESDFVGQHATAMGWGLTSTSILAQPSPVLKEADVPVLEGQVCKDTLGGGHFDGTDMVCTGFLKEVGTDTLYKGDSGGPLIVKDKDGKHTTVGIASFVTLKGLLRKTVTSAVFTKVAAQIKWIQESTDDLCLGQF